MSNCRKYGHVIDKCNQRNFNLNSKTTTYKKKKKQGNMTRILNLRTEQIIWKESIATKMKINAFRGTKLKLNYYTSKNKKKKNFQRK